MTAQPDPLRLLARWIAQAHARGARDPDAMVLATADSRGRPSARVVLYKGLRSREIRFFTNYQSRKGQELARNGRVALVFYWPELGRQIRIEGRAKKTSPAESDEYWDSRPRASRIGAIASAQSSPVKAKRELQDCFARLSRQFAVGPIPRPKHWGGFHVRPDRIEFWTQRASRLHDRVEFSRSGGTRWRSQKLFP